MKTKWLRSMLLGTALAVAAGSAWAQAPGPSTVRVVAKLKVSSTAVSQGRLDPRFGCDGAGASMPVAWDREPYGTRSVVVVLEDLDAPKGSRVRWMLFNIPPGPRALAEGEVPKGAVTGRNDLDDFGYETPCPPYGETHHYRLKVITLFETLNPGPDPKAADILDVTDNYVSGEGELKFSYGR
jgi:Raf kinase inhibitor-like YbhB/YbcL family protein